MAIGLVVYRSPLVGVHLAGDLDAGLLVDKVPIPVTLHRGKVSVRMAEEEVEKQSLIINLQCRQSD